MNEYRGTASCIVVDADRKAHVEARRCADCAAQLTAPSLACPSCGARGSFTPFQVAETGSLHSYSIVHRSFPGVVTPFISAVVDLDDGVTLKGTLRGVAPEPEAIAFGMAVKMVFDDVGQDAKGDCYISYFFEPHV